MIPTLTSERLCLRPLEMSDAPVVQKLAGVFEVADTTLQIPHPYKDGMAEAWIERVMESDQANKEITFAITLRETGELVGAISLVDIKERHRAELGYWVGMPYWNKGFCTEAGAFIVQYVFETLEFAPKLVVSS